jgi:hypothetical protein
MISPTHGCSLDRQFNVTQYRFFIDHSRIGVVPSIGLCSSLLAVMWNLMKNKYIDVVGAALSSGSGDPLIVRWLSRGISPVGSAIHSITYI